jgi:molybdenum cofactor synthesis domain-containing protein
VEAIMKMAVLTISDASWMKMRKDESGPAVKARLESKGWAVPLVEVLPDERPMIESRLRELADGGDYHIIFTTGGTGPAPRDVTPEATRAVIEREMQGLSERMRAEGQKITPFAALSRGVSGIRAKTLIVNLPGSPKGAVESLDVILELIPLTVSLMRP